MLPKLILTILFVLSPFTAEARNPVLRDPVGNSLTLLQKPCTSTQGSLAQISKETRKKAKAADLVYEGKKYKACYLNDGQMIYWADETGHQDVVPKELFKMETKI